MKLPKEIKIGGHIYKVIFPYNFKERADCDGQGCHDSNEIRIKKYDTGGMEYAKSRTMQIFIHEVLHAIDNTFNNQKLDEDTVSRLSEGVFQVLKDNGFLKEEE